VPQSVAEGEAGQLFLERLQLSSVPGPDQPAGDLEEVFALSVVSGEAGLDEVRRYAARALMPRPRKGLHAPEHDRGVADAEADRSGDSHC
jgi:hypothetical protein